MHTSVFAAFLAFAACNPRSAEDTAGDEGAADSDADAALPLILISYGGGSSAAAFEGEYVEEECPADCSANTDPVFGAAQVFVNGALVESPAPSVGDTVAVAITYEDAECNLACGASYYGWLSPTEGTDSSGSLPSNLPCGTGESGVYLGFDFGEVEAGEHSFTLRAEDACGGATERVEGSFTVAM